MVSAESSNKIIFGPTAFLIADQSGLEPIKLGNKITFVFSVTLERICSTLGTQVPISTSQKIGFNPHCIIGAKVVEKVQAAVKISVPGSRFNAFKPNKIAEEPLFTKSPCFLLNNSETSFSN